MTCDSCGFEHKWGDQFRLDVCDFCYDGNVITTRRSQSRRRLRAKRPIVYERMFERRCQCCFDLETLPGLKYLSYDDPGSHYLGKITSEDSCFDGLQQYAPVEEDGINNFRIYKSLSFLQDNRGVYFPLSTKCKRCSQGQGRAIWVVTIAGARSSSAHFPGQDFLEQSFSSLYEQLPCASPPWEIDAPIWQYADVKCYFTHKFVGRACLVCDCNEDPIVSGHFGPRHANLRRGKLGRLGGWSGPTGGEFLHKHVFYHCPYLPGGLRIRDSRQDSKDEALLSLGIDISGSRRHEESESDREPKSESDREHDVDEEELVDMALDSYERDSDSDTH